jgi:hypothetical protein
MRADAMSMSPEQEHRAALAIALFVDALSVGAILAGSSSFKTAWILLLMSVGTLLAYGLTKPDR